MYNNNLKNIYKKTPVSRPEIPSLLLHSLCRDEPSLFRKVQSFACSSPSNITFIQWLKF